MAAETLTESYPGGYFCPPGEPPADVDGNRERRLSQVGATIFTFKNFRSSSDALNRWLYCRVLDNTCRELGVSPDMTDIEITEILRTRHIPFGQNPTEFDFFDGKTEHSSLPEGHPTADIAGIIEFYRARLERKMVSNQVAGDARCDIFDEMGLTATMCDWYARSEEPRFAEMRESILEGLQRIPPEIIERMDAARAFFVRLLRCIAVAAYLNRFVDGVDTALAHETRP